ncbi:MAG: F0F1 ATP synthase subunit A [Firmicutes bacterium]|nr:F0F1 ATP synthase subunit A [Bacillota bacterium]
MEGHGGALFYIGPLGITSAMVTMVAITIGLTLLSYFATRHMKTRPVGLQNFMEKCVEMLRNFIGGMMDKKYVNRYLPFLGTLFIFILISNYSGLLPFAGRLPGLAAPTSVINVTAALAVCTFCVTHYSGIKQHHGGYLNHFTKPFIFMLPLLLIDEFIRPLSLTLRLYGNIFGEETVISNIFNLVPLGVPIIMQALSLLMGFIQAMVFVLLSSIYINGALGEGH